MIVGAVRFHPLVKDMRSRAHAHTHTRKKKAISGSFLINHLGRRMTAWFALHHTFYKIDTSIVILMKARNPG